MGQALSSEMIAAGIREEVLSGVLAPGTALRQDELAERFGVSRVPVREALRVLQAERLIDYSPNRGATVVTLSLEEVLGLLEVRVALECHAIRLAIPNMIDDDFERARNILAEYNAAPDAVLWSGMNRVFHRSLYEPCDVPELLTSIDANHDRFSQFMSARLSMAAGREGPQNDHYAILAACEAADGDHAAQLLDDHIRHTQRFITADARRQRRAANGAATAIDRAVRRTPRQAVAPPDDTPRPAEAPRRR